MINRGPRTGEFSSFINSNKVQPTPPRPRQLLAIKTASNFAALSGIPSSKTPPSIYLLNATSIAKPNAIQQLQADVLSNGVDVVIITESWLKPQHLDSSMSIPGYSIFRHDRRKRKGEGLAIFVKDELNAHIHKQPGLYDDSIELLWVVLEINGRSCYVGAMYHPPKPIYATDDLLHALENSLEEIFSQPGDSLVILAGDFNKLPDQVITSLGLVIEFNQPIMKETVSIRYMHRSMYIYFAKRLIQQLKQNIKLSLLDQMETQFMLKKYHKNIASGSIPLLCMPHL